MYLPQHWHEAYGTIGTGVAALAGLIIVAASVRADQIMTAPHWQLLARNTTLSMIAIMIGSILVLLPQPAIALGAEWIVINLACAIVLPGRVIASAYRSHSKVPLRIPILAVSLYLLAAAGGASLIVHWGGGMYLTTAAYLLYLPLTVINAYALLLPHPKPPDP